MLNNQSNQHNLIDKSCKYHNLLSLKVLCNNLCYKKEHMILFEHNKEIDIFDNLSQNYKFDKD